MRSTSSARSLALVLTLFTLTAGLAPLVSAHDHRGTSAPDVVVDADETFTITSPVSGTFNRFESGGPIRYNESKDLIVTNLEGNENDRFFLQAGVTGPLVQSGLASSSGGGKVNATWSASSITATGSIAGKFNQVGAWYVYPESAVAGNTSQAVARILVNASENLDVTLSADVLRYSPGDVTFRVTVTHVADGSPAAGVTLDFGDFAPGLGPVTTNALGQYDYFGSVSSASGFVITASQNTTGDALPEFEGHATLRVLPASVTVTPSATELTAGSTASLRVTVVDDAGAPFAGATVTSPLFGNGTLVTNADGRADWYGTVPEAGAYAVHARKDVAGDAEPEYSASATVTVVEATPGLSIHVTGDLENGALRIRPPLQGSGLPEPFTLNVTVRADGEIIRPDYYWADGDVLQFKRSDGRVLAPTAGPFDEGTGTFELRDVYPTRNGGVVKVAVQLGDTVHYEDIPIVGAHVSRFPYQMPVDTPGVQSTRLLDGNGDAEPSGVVRIWELRDGVTVTPPDAFGERGIAGTGNEGAGLHGVYEFDVTPRFLGEHLIVGVTGHFLSNGNDTREWSYAIFEAVTAHDLAVEAAGVSPAWTVNASGELSLNVTLPDGRVPDRPQFFVLTGNDLPAFRSQGTLPPMVTDAVAYAVGGGVRAFNFTFHPREAGDHYVFVRTSDGKHDNAHALFTVSVMDDTWSDPAPGPAPGNVTHEDVYAAINGVHGSLSAKLDALAGTLGHARDTLLVDGAATRNEVHVEADETRNRVAAARDALIARVASVEDRMSHDLATTRSTMTSEANATRAAVDAHHAAAEAEDERRHGLLAGAVDAVGARVTASRDAVLSRLDAAESAISGRLDRVERVGVRIVGQVQALRDSMTARFDGVDEAVAQRGLRTVDVQVVDERTFVTTGVQPSYLVLTTLDGVPVDAALAGRVDGDAVRLTVTRLGEGTYRVELPAPSLGDDPGQRAVVITAIAELDDVTYAGSALTKYRA